MKASKRQRSRKKSKSSHPQQRTLGVEPAFSEQEEAFFKQGAALSAESSVVGVERFPDLEESVDLPPSLLRRWLSRATDAIRRRPASAAPAYRD